MVYCFVLTYFIILILIYSTKYLPLIAVKVLSLHLHSRLNSLFAPFQSKAFHDLPTRKTQTNHCQQIYTPHMLTNLHRITLKITHLGKNLLSTVYSFQSKLLFVTLFCCDCDKKYNNPYKFLYQHATLKLFSLHPPSFKFKILTLLYAIDMQNI